MITSLDNQKIKDIRSLKEKKYRDKSGLYLVVGEKSVFEAIKFGQRIKSIVISDNYKGTVPELDCEQITTDCKVFKTLSDDVSPQGILAVLYKPTIEKPKEITRALLLDNVRDPGNLGTILRTAVAFKYNDIFLRNTVDPYNLKTVKASMSGIFSVRFYDISAVSNENIVSEINIPIISADMHGENINNFIPPKSFCLVIGNEANGITKEIKTVSESIVKIPMNSEMESLNAGVSAGILMYLLNQNAKK